MQTVAAGWLFLFGCLLSAQIVPGWHVLELNEAPVGRERGAARVRTAQATVRAALAARAGARARVIGSTDVVMNALIVQSAAAPAELAALPGVRRVWPVYEVHQELDRAVRLLKIREAWEAVGGPERAGAGMKIGILDSGLDLKHPGFHPGEMQPPDGFPKATNEDIKGLLNGKVIVYRTYDAMLGFAESADDRSGHGTAVAMTAAGKLAKSPLAEIQGAAPGAWLGVYKVFAGPNGQSSNTAVVIKALDDAAADGMDVVNLSFGFLPQVIVDLDPLLPALERAAGLGVMPIKSNGNSGPVRLSGSTPSVGSVGMAVGASWTDRIFASGIRLNGGDPLASIPGDGPAPSQSLQAPLKDVASVAADGLACERLPDGSLAGSVALILRGSCTFEVKINTAQAAGAVGVVIYTHAESPNAAGMLVGGATLPAVMISNRDGLKVKAILAETPDSKVEMTFDATLPFPVDADGISSFSSRGPGVDGSIRPDLVAIGEGVLTAAQNGNPEGELYDRSGFIITSGTSFSSPLVAGAYAVLKAYRPGLRLGQYRSLLVNGAAPFPAAGSRPAPVQVGGAGRMDLAASLRGWLAADPPSVSFGMGGQRVNTDRLVRLKNLSQNVGTWRVAVDSGDEVKASVEPDEFSLDVGGEIDLRVRFQGDVQLGEYQGFLLLQRVDAPEDERPQRIAYWYGAPTGKPATITPIPSAPATAGTGSTLTVRVLVTDAIGATVPWETPRVTVLEGSAVFLNATSEEATFPGYWSLRIRMGGTAAETNRFRVEAGEVVREFSIRTR